MFLGQPILVVIISFDHTFYIMRGQMVVLIPMMDSSSSELQSRQRC